mmetsp:Transcript_4943/g.7735  ORF Transcript_4943/g.7735 Transcript_4943/m.7735 type:complete len:113 (-) Transcript_4943:495-833(-)
MRMNSPETPSVACSSEKNDLTECIKSPFLDQPLKECSILSGNAIRSSAVWYINKFLSEAGKSQRNSYKGSGNCNRFCERTLLMRVFYLNYDEVRALPPTDYQTILIMMTSPQ